MKNNTPIRIAGTAVMLYMAWNGRDVTAAWFHSPFDRMGLPSFIVWFLPVILVEIIRQLPDAPRGNNFDAGFLVGLGLSLAGVALNLNFLKYTGLAFACAGFLPRGAALIFWLATGLAWMPALGWVFSPAGTFWVNSMRLILAACGTLLMSLRVARYEN